MTSQPPFRDLTVGAYADLVAARTPAPGGGATAAVVVALAASLVAMAARYSDRQLEGAAARAERADAIQRRALELADDDATAYEAVLAAGRGTAARAEAMERATAVPREVADLAGEVATLAATLADDGNRRLAGDATTALLLARAGAEAAAGLVAINLEEGGLV